MKKLSHAPILVAFSLLLGCDGGYISSIGIRETPPLVPGEESFIIVNFQLQGGGDHFATGARTVSLESADPGVKILTKPVSCDPPFHETTQVRFKCLVEKNTKLEEVNFRAKVWEPDGSVITHLAFSHPIKKS